MTDLNPGLGTRDRIFIGYEVTLIIRPFTDVFARDFVHCFPSVSSNRTWSAIPAALGVPVEGVGSDLLSRVNGFPSS